MESQALSTKFNTGSLIKYALPTVIMMLFINIYVSADGIFVSNFVSEDALSALNIVYPYIAFILALGLMLSTGSNAIIAKKLGEKKNDEAKSFFSLIFIVGAIFGITLTILGFIFNDQLLHMLGATKVLYPYAKEYLSIFMLFTPIFLVKVLSESFFITIGKPHFGLILSVIGGCTNIILDYLFIKVFSMGIAGAAWASSIGYSISGTFSIVYFACNRKNALYFTKPHFNGKLLLKSCFNGSSEFINNIAISITTLLYNYAMLKYVGETGVAAISIILYMQMIFTSIFVGYSCGVAPVISFKYGEKDSAQLRKIIKISFTFIGITSLSLVLLSIFGVDIGIGIFVSKGTEVFDIAKHGFLIFSISYIFMGFNILICSMFTALGNGKVSALLSIIRTLVFLCIGIQLLPLVWGINGIWLSVPIAETLSFVLSIIFFLKYRKRYCL